MADQNNPGQFGNRKDTTEQAKAGGVARAKEDTGMSLSDAGKLGAEAQSTADKRKGGLHRNKGSNN